MSISKQPSKWVKLDSWKYRAPDYEGAACGFRRQPPWAGSLKDVFHDGLVHCKKGSVKPESQGKAGDAFGSLTLQQCESPKRC
eukprot:5054230-Amphidinium_carterae.1